VPVTFGWPDRLELDGTGAGGARFRIGEVGGDGVPLWLVVGVELAVGAAGDPRAAPRRTSVQEVGAGEVSVPLLIEAFARHVLTWLHTFETEGFAPVRSAYLSQARAYREELALEVVGARHTGRFAGLTDDGDLILRRPAGIETVSLAAALALSDSQSDG
jgi:biotin-(acetyl-CoA carboxylase) ligase